MMSPPLGRRVFMEPDGALDINNEIRDLRSTWTRREIIKILHSLQDDCGIPAIPLLRKGDKFLRH